MQRELSAKLTEGLYSCKRMIKQSLRHDKSCQFACKFSPIYTREAEDSSHICGGRAIAASGGYFDEPIGSACGMPQGGYRKPPERLVVMTVFCGRKLTCCRSYLAVSVVWILVALLVGKGMERVGC